MMNRIATLNEQPLDVIIDRKDPSLVYASCINGDLVIWHSNKNDDKDEDDDDGEGASSNVQIMPSYHRKSCRSLTQTPNGSLLISASKDKSLKAMDLTHNKQQFHWKRAHEHAINRVLAIDNNMLASGDDEGVVRMWDMRKPDKHVREYHDNEDYISHLEMASDGRTLVATGGDGYVSVFDIRKKELLARSDNLETDIMCCAFIKNDKKLVCGMGDGVLGVFNCGDWGDIKDRIVGHPSSVESICRLNQDLVCTASSDGILRVLSIQPNQFLGVIGDHDDFPVESIALSVDGNWLASCGHDDTLRLWDVQAALQSDGDSDGDDLSDNDEDDSCGETSKHSSTEEESDGQRQPAISSAGGIKRQRSAMLITPADPDDRSASKAKQRQQAASFFSGLGDESD